MAYHNIRGCYFSLYVVDDRARAKGHTADVFQILRLAGHGQHVCVNI